MIKTNTHLGVGLYSIADAARISGVKPSSILRWADEESGLISRVLDRSESLLTFRELMEIQFIKMFRDAGVSMQTIRHVSKLAASRFGTDYPFSVKRFDTDGKTIFATMIGGTKKAKLIEDLKQCQYVFEPIIRPFFKKLEYQGPNNIARFWPREKSGRIVLDPLRKFGQPIDSKSGISTRAIFDATRADGGQDSKTVAEWLGIPVSAVDAAVAFEKPLAA